MKMHLDGLTDVINEINRSVDDVTEVVDEMLSVGASEAERLLKNHIIYYEHHVWWDLYNGIRVKAPAQSKFRASERYVQVFPHDNDRKGVSNAKKGAIINYRSHARERHGIGWFDAAVEEAEQPVEAAMREIWENYKTQSL